MVLVINIYQQFVASQLIYRYHAGNFRHSSLRINRAVMRVLRGTHAGLQQMALAAAGRPPQVDAALGRIARQRLMQAREQFLIPARNEIIKGRPPVRSDVEQQL